MKQVIITITAQYPEDATLEEITQIAGAAYVQVAEPADDEGWDLSWFPASVDYTVTVSGQVVA